VVGEELKKDIDHQQVYIAADKSAIIIHITSRKGEPNIQYLYKENNNINVNFITQTLRKCKIMVHNCLTD